VNDVTADDTVLVRLKVNGVDREASVAPRTLLSDLLRDHLGLTGTNVGCEHGYCGACTVIIDGETMRSCLVLALVADGADVTTVEGLATDGELNALQQAFQEAHGLQCGFCTPGLLMTSTELLAETTGPLDDEAIRAAIAGNICRCTGYVHVVDAIRAASESRAS
jgi:aerobic carbon-monoxide dehydrogenase small subunit